MSKPKQEDQAADALAEEMRDLFNEAHQATQAAARGAALCFPPSLPDARAELQQSREHLAEALRLADKALGRHGAQ
jgi:hypothetical protein